MIKHESLLMRYPLCMYHLDGSTCIVDDDGSEADQKAAGWEYTPAAFGVETCPGLEPDPFILSMRANHAANHAPASLDVVMPPEGTSLDDMTREQLIELAANRAVEIDKRWGADRLREALA